MSATSATHRAQKSTLRKILTDTDLLLSQTHLLQTCMVNIFPDECYVSISKILKVASLKALPCKRCSQVKSRIPREPNLGLLQLLY